MNFGGKKQIKNRKRFKKGWSNQLDVGKCDDKGQPGEIKGDS
jgi:hypothetical protein